MKFGKSYWIKVLSAHGLLSVADALFDHVAYPFILEWLGPVNGFLLATFIGLVVCSGFLFLYERGKEDWLGVNAVEAVKEHGQSWIARLDSVHVLVRIVAWIPTRIFLVVLWAIKKNDVLAFFALSIYEDAFKTTAFLRKGRFGSFGWKDACIFLGSLIISNVYWTIRWSILLELVKAAYRTIVN